MVIAGLIGGSGAGKGEVARVLASHGIAIIDGDKVARAVVRPGMPALLELESEFGGVILRADGSLDRAALARLAFGDPERLAALNRITHRHITREIVRALERVAADGARAAVIDAAALIESGFGPRCDVIIAVTAPRELRIARIIARDGMEREDAERRVDAQKPVEFYTAQANIVIVNDGDAQALRDKAATAAESILNRRW